MQPKKHLKYFKNKLVLPLVYYPRDSLGWVRQHLFNKSTNSTIYYVADQLGWVQGKRIEYLSRYLPDMNFKPLTAHEFCRWWNRGWLRKKAVYFTTWRIFQMPIINDYCSFEEADYDYFATSVTSHQNIGGGLNVCKAIPTGQNPKKVLEFAISLLKRFRVVTVNSLILYNLLSNHINELIYVPNGVDTSVFYPDPSQKYNPNKIRIGWVGKLRAAKNYETISQAFTALEAHGFITKSIAVPKNAAPSQILSSTEMCSFYHGIDYYLCASWHEGTPNPALEAAACGVPIVTTLVGNMPELIKHGANGFFVEPNIESIIKQFEQIRELSVKDYQRLSRNIKNDITANWTWDKRATNYRTAFEQLLGTTTSPSKLGVSIQS